MIDTDTLTADTPMSIRAVATFLGHDWRAVDAALAELPPVDKHGGHKRWRAGDACGFVVAWMAYSPEAARAWWQQRVAARSEGRLGALERELDKLPAVLRDEFELTAAQQRRLRQIILAMRDGREPQPTA